MNLKKNYIDFKVFQGNISENFKKKTYHARISLPKIFRTESKILSCVTGELFNVVDLKDIKNLSEICVTPNMR